MSTTAIAKTTSAAQSSQIDLTAAQSIQVHTPDALSYDKGEAVRLERTHDSGVNWNQVLDSNNRGVVLSPTIRSALVNGPGSFRLVKTATENEVGVYYD